MKDKILFDPLERQIVVHRLEVPDAIFEALTIPILADKEIAVTYDEVEASAERLVKSVESGSIVWDDLSRIDKEVFCESIEGSTCDGWNPRDTPEFDRVKRSHDRLLAKLSNLEEQK